MIIKTKKNIYCFLLILFSTLFFYQNSFAEKNDKTKDVSSIEKIEDFDIDKKENFVVEIPEVLNLDARVALNRNEVNIIGKEQKNRLLENKVLLIRELNTMNMKSKIWMANVSDIVNEIKKKFPNSIIVLESFSNTQFTNKDNIKESEKNALIVAEILRTNFGLDNTMCVIGLGTEENAFFEYNCVILSVIKDVGFYDSIQ